MLFNIINNLNDNSGELFDPDLDEAVRRSFRRRLVYLKIIIYNIFKNEYSKYFIFTTILKSICKY